MISDLGRLDIEWNNVTKGQVANWKTVKHKIESSDDLWLVTAKPGHNIKTMIIKSYQKNTMHITLRQLRLNPNTTTQKSWKVKNVVEFTVTNKPVLTYEMIVTI